MFHASSKEQASLLKMWVAMLLQCLLLVKLAISWLIDLGYFSIKFVGPTGLLQTLIGYDSECD